MVNEFDIEISLFNMPVEHLAHIVIQFLSSKNFRLIWISNFISLNRFQQESESGDATSRQAAVKSVSRTSKRPDSTSTNKSHTKQTGARGGNRAMANQTTSRTNIRLDRSNNTRPFDDEYENLSDHETNPKPRQKNVRYAKYDSSGRIINGAEETEDDSQRDIRINNRDDNDLYTVREGQTLESDSRYKKR